MVLIQIDDEVFDVADEVFTNSVTMKNLQQDTGYHIGHNQPIHLGISTKEWLDYISFLNNETPTLSSLKVIDYLENIDQMRDWYHQRLKMGESLLRIKQLFNNTTFMLEDIDPVFKAKTIESMLPYLTHTKEIPTVYIQHIFLTFYNWNLYNIYRLTFDHPDINTLPKRVLNALIEGKFIVKENDEPYSYYDSNAIFGLPTGQCPNSLKPKIISPSIAKVYDVKVYKEGKQLVTCLGTQYPYLERQYKLDPVYGYETKQYTLCCSAHDQGIKSLNLYDNTAPTPFPHLYGTGITIGDTHVFSYNISSSYNRNYKLFLVNENNPIFPAVYTFSL
jgi:hypothetical protein